MEILRTIGLKKYYGNGAGLVKALDGINMSIEEGEFAAVVGTSGSGKSTLLHMLGGLDYPTEGKVIVDGKDISVMKETELTIFRRRNIGFIFQNYNLVPVLNVYENVVLPLELDGEKPDREFVREVMETLGIYERQASMPNQLSGGQQQRVAIARALASKPAIILADEPTGNLDSRNSKEVMGLLKVTGEQFGQTIVMITHNEALAQLCSRVIRIEDGKIWKDGKNSAQNYGTGTQQHGFSGMRDGTAAAKSMAEKREQTGVGADEQKAAENVPGRRLQNLAGKHAGETAARNAWGGIRYEK